MPAVNAHLAQLTALLRHKQLVIVEGRKLGVPWLQLLRHDVSKCLPDEWGAGVALRRGRSIGHEALHKHYRRNPHHPQYWLKNGRPEKMPERFCREMLADWHAVGRVRGVATTDWYKQYGYSFPFHPETRAWVETKLFCEQVVRGEMGRSHRLLSVRRR